MRRFSRTIAVLAVMAVAGTVLASAGTATAVQAEHDRVVSAVPSAATPNIENGTTYAIVKVGSKVIVGGSFNEVRDRTSGVLHSRPYIFAFDANTGVVDTAFAPSLGNEVLALQPGPTPGTVYVAGRFNHAAGNQGYNKVVLMNVSNGSLVTSFKAPAINGAVFTIKEAGGRLYVGGKFTAVGSTPKGGLVTLDPLTGAIDPYLDIELTENHNYNGTGAQAPIGPDKLDITPDGSRMVVIGNFKKANELDRDQVLVVDLTGPAAEIANWHTDHYKPACSRNAFDKWVRDLDISPDGSFFVIGTTGGPHLNTVCDTVARFETFASGTSIHPTWVNWAGGDTILSVAITGAAVYAGGHQRWMNNHNGRDSAQTGAVGRPGIVALDPVSGVPLSWNPGRHPRGYGATVLYATPDGLYVGSDTEWIGNFDYRRGRVAYFPLAGGATLPPGESASLPAQIYFTNVPVEVGAGVPDILYRVNAAGPELPALDDGPVWEADNATSSPYRNNGSSMATNANNVPRVNASVPETTPIALFNSERWDPPAAPEMQWTFPVPAGTEVELRLYFAERTWTYNEPGTRVFDITVDGVLVADDFDVAAAVGYNEAMMLPIPVTSDGVVDIEFVHQVANPNLRGIEIVRSGETGGGEVGPGIGKRSYDGATVGSLEPVGGADGTAWNNLRGAFLVDDTLFYGMSNGTFWRRSFDGATVGLPLQLTPHLDAKWDGVATGSGTTTYSGVMTNFANSISGIRSMYYTDGKLFYTRANQNNLYWRWFNPESGLAGSREFVLAGSGLSSSLNNLSNTSGLLFVSDGYAYWVRAADGRLIRRPLVDNGPGSEQVTTSSLASRQFSWGGNAVAVGGPAIDGVDWRTPGAFLRAE